MQMRGQPSAFRRSLEAVKRRFASRKDGTRGRLRRHLEGLELGIASVGIAVAAALLALPRATTPNVLPLPLPDAAQLQAERRADAARALEARTRGLSFDVRAVGDALRRLGLATRERRERQALIRRDLREYAQRALSREGTAPLLALRALQTELFTSAAARFAKTDQASADLDALGGDFVEIALRNGWLVKGAPIDEIALESLFRARWNDLTGLDAHPAFASSLDDFRARYAFLLSIDAVDEARGKLQRSHVEKLAARDQDYPADFARGVLLFRAHAYAASAEAFRRHVVRHPDGPWTLRAKNHLLAAAAEVPPE
jgi:hypothetical protein